MDYRPIISIIIPTLNSINTLEACLISIASLDYPKDKLELIVIDNGSTDGTLDVARKYDARVFIKPDVTISHLRNIGAKNAKGEIYAFTDSDCMVSKDWLNSAIVHLVRDEIGAAGCGYDISQNAPWVERVWPLLKNIGINEANFLPGGNLIVKREAFMSIGGFNEELITGEDYYFCKRLREVGYKVISDSRIQVVHLGNPKSLYDFFKREIWYGRGMLGIEKSDRINKPFIVSNVYLICFVGLIVGIFIYVSFKAYFLLAISALFMVFIPLVAALRRSIQSRNIKKFLPLIPIYFAYCAGRMISLIQIYFSPSRQR